MPGSRAIRGAMKVGWIRTVAVKQDTLVRSMQRDLDRGEAEAIALAIQEETEWVLLDERDGRKLARSMGLKIAGILGVLLKAWRLGELESLRGAMDTLRSKAGFYIREDLYQQFIQRGNREL